MCDFLGAREGIGWGNSLFAGSWNDVRMEETEEIREVKEIKEIKEIKKIKEMKQTVQTIQTIQKYNKAELRGGGDHDVL